MLVSTTGSDFWPATPEGRVPALPLAIFGYIAASLATFFIGQEAAAPDSDVAGAREIAALRQDIAALREALQRSASD